MLCVAGLWIGTLFVLAYMYRQTVPSDRLQLASLRAQMGRMGKAEEFARMACFLCSDAGSFITGVAINVDGGASPVV